MQETRFVRGLLIALPLSLALWAALAVAVGAGLSSHSRHEIRHRMWTLAQLMKRPMHIRTGPASRPVKRRSSYRRVADA